MYFSNQMYSEVRGENCLCVGKTYMRIYAIHDAISDANCSTRRTN